MLLVVKSHLSKFSHIKVSQEKKYTKKPELLLIFFYHRNKSLFGEKLYVKHRNWKYLKSVCGRIFQRQAKGKTHFNNRKR